MNSSSNIDIRKIATGEIYPSFPLIFPQAQARPLPNSDRITLIFEPTTAQFMEETQKRAVTSFRKHLFWGIGSAIALGVALQDREMMATAFAVTLIVFVGLMVYKKCMRSVIPSEKNRRFAMIEYSLEDNKFIQEHCLSDKDPLVDHLDRLFRDYRLNVIQTAKQLQKEIVTSIKNHRQGIGKTGDSLLSRMDRLFKSGQLARDKVRKYPSRKVGVFIGQTGTGKTTLANYLYGCRMKAVKPEYVRKPSRGATDYVIVAENSKNRIGHKIGWGSSETFNPELFPIKKDLVLCDCPGLSDLRGTEVALCNALSIVDIIHNAKSIQGFLFVINYNDALEGKAEGFQRDLKAMQLLLRNFEPYKNSVLFLITKAGRDVSLDHARNCFSTILDTVIRNASDADLQRFCWQIQASGVLNQRMVFCHPLDPSKRASVTAAIRNLTSLNPAEMDIGHPLPPEVFRQLDKLQEEIVREVEQALEQFKGNLITCWKEKIDKNRTIEGAAALFEELEKMLERGLTLEILRSDFGQKFQSGLDNWEKVTRFLPPPQDPLDFRVRHKLDEIARAIRSLQFDAFISSVKATLESYQIQVQVNKLNNFMGEDKDKLSEKIQGLMNMAQVPVVYGDKLHDVVKACDALQTRTLLDLMQKNLTAPFHFVREGRTIKVRGSGEKIAWTQVIEKIGDQLSKAREIEMDNITTLYFDQDLKGKQFAGKSFRIYAKEIEVIGRHRLNLYLSPFRAATFFITGMFTRGGIGQMEGEDIIVDETLREDPSRTIKYSW